MEIPVTIALTALLVGLGYMLAAYANLSARMNAAAKRDEKADARRDQLIDEVRLGLERVGTQVLTLEGSVVREERARTATAADSSRTVPSAPELIPCPKA